MKEIVMGKDYPKSLEEFREIVKDTTRDDLVHGLYDISKHALEFQTELQDANDSIIWWKNRYEAKCYYLSRKMKDIETLQNDLDRANSKLKEQTERNLEAIKYIQDNCIGNYFQRYTDEVYKMLDDIKEILEGVAK